MAEVSHLAVPPAPPAAGEHRTCRTRLRLKIRGQVQGVGFRPQVARVARQLGLEGWVLNTGDGVTVEVQGAAVARFPETLRHSLPPQARIDALDTEWIEARTPTEDDGFRIRESEGAGAAGAAAANLIPADLAICSDCLTELFDPTNRRFGYPLIACCNCGPRLSMVRSLPYDRVRTSMNDFPLCQACSAEYDDVDDRRFHAEPTACADCGPSYSHDAATIARVLEDGGIVALKGTGGYQLLCDARSVDAVERLRARKRRETKPLALLLANQASAERHLVLNDAGRQALCSPARPIVVAPVKDGRRSPLALAALAPGLTELGAMLPAVGLQYQVFHELLGQPPGKGWPEAPNDLALVCTSANDSGAPIVIDDAAAVTDLSGIADLIVSHNREISDRVDDSVLRQLDGRCVPLRRARGLVPAALTVAPAAATVLALGATQKNTACLLADAAAAVTQHIGDLDDPATVAAERTLVDQLLDRLGRRPDAIACDWHPDFQSTRLAERLAEKLSVPLVQVQHHHAHVAAVMAEQRLEGAVLGVALDGYGYGIGGAAWGGELLEVEGPGFSRIGHLAPLAMPGGDRAAREPWRLATAWLVSRGFAAVAHDRFAGQPLLPAVATLAQQLQVPLTTSAGRLFDCAAALLGLLNRQRYEGEAAMLLEARATAAAGVPAAAAGSGLFTLQEHCLDLSPVLDTLVDESDAAAGAARFHSALLAGLSAWIGAAAARRGLRRIVLAGGCFQNRWLAEQLPRALQQQGLEVFSADALPANDGGLSLGQGWVTRQLLAAADTSAALPPSIPSFAPGEDLCVSPCR
ncbi:MAG: carbamoyltransferase HypF [Pseudomonadota bacterium]